MRTWACALVLVSSLAEARDDDPASIHLRRLDEQSHDEPLLHLDGALLDRAAAEGVTVDARALTLELGPRARLAAQGASWQTGSSPSMSADGLRLHGWQAAGELSYDLGPFRVGVNASLGRTGDLSHRMVGLFAYRTFKLSRWMTAWITLGLSWEQWDTPAIASPRPGTSLGLSLGTTFR